MPRFCSPSPVNVMFQRGHVFSFRAHNMTPNTLHVVPMGSDFLCIPFIGLYWAENGAQCKCRLDGIFNENSKFANRQLRHSNMLILGDENIEKYRKHIEIVLTWLMRLHESELIFSWNWKSIGEKKPCFLPDSCGLEQNSESTLSESKSESFKNRLESGLESESRLEYYNTGPYANEGMTPILSIFMWNYIRLPKLRHT